MKTIHHPEEIVPVVDLAAAAALFCNALEADLRLRVMILTRPEHRDVRIAADALRAAVEAM